MRAINILKLLLQAFKLQSFKKQCLFAFIIFILIVWIALFFSAYVIWFVIQLIFKEIFLRGLEWYLIKFNVVDKDDLSDDKTNNSINTQNF